VSARRFVQRSSNRTWSYCHCFFAWPTFRLVLIAVFWLWFWLLFVYKIRWM